MVNREQWFIVDGLLRYSVKTGGSGGGFDIYVIVGIATVGDGPAVANHPGIQIDTVRVANGDNAVINTPLIALAGDGVVGDFADKGFARLLAASPSHAVPGKACLVFLRRIYAIQVITDPGDLNGVTVDDTRRP